jgi:hypothetical protein
VGGLTVTAVVSGLTAAGLVRRNHHLATRVFEQGERSKSNLRTHEVDQTGHEECDPGSWLERSD